jgi:hypothetical protein
LANVSEAKHKKHITNMTKKNETTEVKVVKISEVKSNPNNPRVIKDGKFAKLVKSIEEFPEMSKVRPIVVNTDMVVLGGNMRLKAMKEAGWTEVPIQIVDWSEEKQKEFVIKDNVGFGEWDWDILANEWDNTELEEWGLDTISNQNWEQLDYIDENLPAPEARKDNVITIVVPDAWLGEIKEIEQLIKDTISTSYSGCEIK